MADKVGEHWQGDTKVTWNDDGDTLGIHYRQDITPVLERIAAMNRDGGTKAHGGMGRLLYEFPVTLVMEHAIERGIDYGALCAKVGYEDEWHAMGRKWSKLSLDRQRQYFSVTQ